MGREVAVHRSGWRAAMLVLAIATGCSTTTAGQIPAQAPPSIAAHAAPVAGPAVTGTVRDTAGRPVAGATVILAVAPSGAEQFGTAIKAIGSLGILCFTGCTPLHRQVFSARDGSYAVPVPAGNSETDAYSLTVAVAQSSMARAATSLSLPRSTRHGRRGVPVVVSASSPVVRADAGHDMVVPPAVPGRFRVGPMSAALNTEAGDPPVEDGQSETITDGYDPRVVEDEHVLLTTVQTGREGRYPAVFSSSLDVAGHLVPVSRHASCYVEGSRGPRIAQHPCGLTDGVLDSTWHPTDDPRCLDGPCPGRPQHDHRDVTVVLSQPVRGGLLVVRGCTDCVAMVSAGGQSFHRVGSQPFGSPDDVLVLPLPGRLVRAVRIQTETGGFFDSLREVSVFTTSQQ